MKILALAASAALVLAGVSIASAQSMNSNEKPSTPPSSINKGSDQPNARTSGTEPKAAAQTTAPGKKTMKMKKAKKSASKKNKAAVSPADINKGSGVTNARTSGSQPKSMAK
jgi:hypothetical protein